MTTFHERFTRARVKAELQGHRITRFEVSYLDYCTMVHETQPHVTTNAPPPRTLDHHKGEYCGLPYDEVDDHRSQLVALRGHTFPF